ncbi:uncharacterized protein SPPG_08147 [Spizellomyces punctatus DAOM BR117]|uniref:Uncharacterized protein n=1 Tax=Spizellomyces punctatus (strain DAOM BR117) TaxID=645134 RepID=A0A0L0H505_SPIPD|nr:uncharacterized protein SPPG_08147 [Spizellomyces punctatus DAOM BR117]KNC96560.1 hypothetical protein SPPG_08147 [Spizellomyces punctatus DAOM BR117]|eukprot:XP_016604600.1 hypothetical protein SPPG_08147 [Spizellomyces punctatus DAOM BR117]
MLSDVQAVIKALLPVMPRLIPAFVDCLLLASLMAGLRRVGNVDFATETISSPALRWIVLQFLFLGEGALDVFLTLVRRYPKYFRPRIMGSPAPKGVDLPTSNHEENTCKEVVMYGPSPDVTTHSYHVPSHPTYHPPSTHDHRTAPSGTQPPPTPHKFPAQHHNHGLENLSDHSVLIM